jgi:hypothetical protein
MMLVRQRGGAAIALAIAQKSTTASSIRGRKTPSVLSRKSGPMKAKDHFVLSVIGPNLSANF